MPKTKKSNSKKKNSVTTDTTLLNQLNKIFTSHKLDPLETPTEGSFDVDKLPTGFPDIDEITMGGFPVGKISLVWGPEKSGKSTLAVKTMAEFQARGGKGFYYDLEGGVNELFAMTQGLNLIDGSVVVRKSTSKDYAEVVMDVVKNVIINSDVELIIIDSISSLVPKSENEGSSEDNTIGLVARILSIALRQFVGLLEEHKKTLVLISQEREDVGKRTSVGRPTPVKPTGGRAVLFYNSLTLYVKPYFVPKSERKDFFEGDIRIGHIIKATIQKARHCTPFQSIETDFFYKPLRRILGLLKSNYGNEKIIKRAKNNHARFEYTDKNGTIHQGLMPSKQDWESLLEWFKQSNLLFDFFEQTGQNDIEIINNFLKDGDITQEMFDSYIETPEK